MWETQRANYKDQVAQTAGPVIVKGKMINGSRCNPQSPLPGGCFSDLFLTFALYLPPGGRFCYLLAVQTFPGGAVGSFCRL